MSAKKIYTCDICSKNIKNPENSFGINISKLNNLLLGGYGATDEKHVCYSCAEELRTQLNSPEIEKIITSHGRPTTNSLSSD